MAHKHLYELLSEDQEPFVLQNYIEERRCQVKRSVPRDHVQVKRRKPISDNSSFPANFCKKACLFSFHCSPDVRKSPLFDFSSPLKSPNGNSNKLFTHIPSKRAALLLEAALRIQKQPSSSKPQTTGKILGSGLLGSLLKRINLRKRNRKPQIKGNEMRVSVKDILRWDSSDGRRVFAMERRHDQDKMEILEGIRVVSEMGLSCSSNSRISSVWSESNEDKSEDLETSSSRSDDEVSEEMEFLADVWSNGDCSSCEKAFCPSPFRFALQKSPSPGRRTPEFGSPAMSPRRRVNEVKQREEGSVGDKEYEEEEKEQCSPVSVLDSAFDTDKDDDDDDDDDGGDKVHINRDGGDHRHRQPDYDGEEGEDDQLQWEEVDHHSYDDELECSFAIVQRAKQQLLQKLRRFERLADLNPIELERRMSEEDDEDDENEQEECDDSYGCMSPDEDDEDTKDDEGSFVESVYSRFKPCEQEGKGKGRIPGDMKRLILELITEEGRRDDEDDGVDREIVLNNVSQRLEAWKEVESDTIDMMFDLDLRREGDEWKRCQEQVQEMGMEIEHAIFGLLLQELSDEVVHS